MLIICYDDFCDEMGSFVNWKNQKGIKTTLVPKSQAGNTASNIKNYVQNFYNTHNFFLYSEELHQYLFQYYQNIFLGLYI